ncbi:hypothetical protein CTAYLR_002834 [Chrysophaeum taylorii]|uniref:peptidylprolyl isomerase n=1 Tax=Chrysophaeum taylorii TaxID=2483200 RepID=A0AAD7U802_9STRA|nr:hypothetical protein CTAYLR_002834 [Chrysophaeum taylorii]
MAARSPAPAAAEEEGEECVMEYVARAVEHKMRGNERFKEGQHEAANENYAVGIDIIAELDKVISKKNNKVETEVEVNEVRVSLLLNRSMALLRLERTSEALECASKAVEIQPENVKAVYRCGVARARLNQHEAALKDFARAVELEPTNRDAKRELAIVREKVAAKRSADKKRMSGALLKKKGLYGDVEAERERRKLEEEAALAVKRRKHAEDNERRERRGEAKLSFDDWVKAEDEAQKKRDEEDKKRRERLERDREEKRRRERLERGEEVVVLDGDDDLGDECRGYKVLADGRKTSYFTQVPDDHTRDLLEQSGGPKKLDRAENHALAPKSSDSGSAWNAAGTTFEERSQTKWVDDNLKKHLANAHTDDIRVTNVKKLSGEASIVVSRKIPRYIFDYSATLEWESADATYKGTLAIPELSSTVVDGNYDQHIHFKKKKKSSSLRDDADADDPTLVRFKQAVNDAIADFVAEYRTRVLR